SNAQITQRHSHPRYEIVLWSFEICCHRNEVWLAGNFVTVCHVHVCQCGVRPRRIPDCPRVSSMSAAFMSDSHHTVAERHLIESVSGTGLPRKQGHFYRAAVYVHSRRKYEMNFARPGVFSHAHACASRE